MLRQTHDRVAVVDDDVYYRPMATCPLARKVILLNPGGVAVLGAYNGRDTFWRGWSPLPVRPLHWDSDEHNDDGNYSSAGAAAGRCNT